MRIVAVGGRKRGPKIVALGGGHGLAKALRALRLLDVEPTAVVTVADDGGSSGRLRRDLDIPAPGDLRMALLTLAGDADLADVLAHRFADGDLRGHALGNLLLVALAERHDGHFGRALEQAGRLLRCRGRVVPATLHPVVLHGRVGGRDVEGQVTLMGTRGHVEALWLDPAVPASPEAVEAVLQADAVVVGPGSLFTSVLATLLPEGLAEAVGTTRARVVHVANLATQPGETEGMDLRDHVRAFARLAPASRLDAVLVHDGPSVGGSGAPLDPRWADPSDGIKLLHADLAARDPGGRPVAVHDPARLATALVGALSMGEGGAHGRPG